MKRLGIALIALSLGVSSRSVAEESLAGRWKAEFVKTERPREYYFAILQEGDKLSGALISPRSGAYPFTSASVGGGKLMIDVKRPYKEEEVVFVIRGAIEVSGQLVQALVGRAVVRLARIAETG